MNKEEVKYDIGKITRNVDLFIEREGVPRLFDSLPIEKTIPVPSKYSFYNCSGRPVRIYEDSKVMVTPPNKRISDIYFGLKGAVRDLMYLAIREKAFQGLYTKNVASIRKSILWRITNPNWAVKRLPHYPLTLEAMVKCMESSEEAGEHDEFNVQEQPSLRNGLMFTSYFLIERRKKQGDLDITLELPDKLIATIESIPERLKHIEYDWDYTAEKLILK